MLFETVRIDHIGAGGTEEDVPLTTEINDAIADMALTFEPVGGEPAVRRWISQHKCVAGNQETCVMKTISCHRLSRQESRSRAGRLELTPPDGVVSWWYESQDIHHTVGRGAWSD